MQLVGTLLLIESIAFAVCLVVSVFYGDSGFMAFAISMIAAFATGFLLRYAGRGARTTLTRYDSFVVVAVSWLASTVMGMLPYLITGCVGSVADAFFETMSGLTTTGATVIDNLDSLPRSVHFWRAITNWVGGLGIVIFTLALLPSNSVGEIKLFAAEVTGPKSNKLHPRFKTTIRWLLSIYMLLTVSCAAALYFAGMGLFDSVCHAFTTTATGGFSTHSESIGYFNSPTIEYVEIVFMFLSGINFTMLYMLFLRGKFKVFFTNSELKAYVFIMLTASAAISVLLYFHSGYDIPTSVRTSLFHVVSIGTTSGFVSSDITVWHPTIQVILAIVMFTGACAGSTSGGFKIVRIVALFKITKNEFKYILHPRAIIPVRINNSTMNYSMEHTLLSFATLYVAFIIAGMIVLSIMGIPLTDAMGISLTSVGNAGPEFGNMYGAMSSWSPLPESAKWVSSFLMFAGRLEIFTIIMLFVPRFWKDY